MAEEGAKRRLQRALVTRILGGDGRASGEARLAAFNDEVSEEPLRTLVTRVAKQPASITDEDVASVKAAGISEDAIFELVICAAVGEATRQYDAAMAALERAAPAARE